MKETVELGCSFCGKKQSDVVQLIAGPTSYICNTCILMCMDVITEKNHGDRCITCSDQTEVKLPLNKHPKQFIADIPFKICDQCYDNTFVKTLINAVAGEQKPIALCDYTNPKPPEDYTCAECNAWGCRLWKQSNKFVNPALMCDACLTKKNKNNPGKKTILSSAAIPPNKESTWYVHVTKLTPEMITWWENLPIEPPISTQEKFFQ